MILPSLFAFAIGEEIDLPNRIGVIVPSGEEDYKEQLESDINGVLLDMGRFRVVSTEEIRSVLPEGSPNDCWGLNIKKFKPLRDSLKLDYLVLACLSRLDSYWDSYRDTLGHLHDFIKASATVYVRVINLEDEKTVLSVMTHGTSEDTSVTSRHEGMDRAYKDCLSDIRWHLKEFFVLRGKVIEKDRGLFVINIGEEIGAKYKMKFQVVKNKQRVGFLEIIQLDIGKSWAKALQGRRKIKPGYEVKELPFGLTFCEFSLAFINTGAAAPPNPSLSTDGLSRLNTFGLGFGVGQTWHFQGGFLYGYGQRLHLGRLDLNLDYRIQLIEDYLWGYIGLAAAPGFVIQPFHADTLLFGDSTGTTTKFFITAGPHAGFKIRIGALGIDLRSGYLLKNTLSNWEYTKTINKVRFYHDLKPEWLSHPEVTLGNWEIGVALSYNFEIYK